MSKTFAMTQDFAAISSATMAALLILVATELAASSSQLYVARQQLLIEYAPAIRASFDAFYSGTPLTPDQKKNVERELHRYRSRSYSHAFELYWRVGYGLAAFMCLAGLALVLRWSALTQHPKGYTTATLTLVAIAVSALLLLAGFWSRQWFRARQRRYEGLLSLCAVLQVPDAQDAGRMMTQWMMAVDGGGFYDLGQQNPFLMTERMLRYLRRHGPRNFR
ncbi:hypothetical protein [Streptomyces sp. Root369]|uniref:hypothetical protein n=1 Tax=Streptomyces sp. Root369 TaxID=1736523 RepID=UPI000AB40971|nr:hypothetical protein [Streptomyces sp. Root369]